MLGFVSILLFLHSGFSALRSRKYFQANQQPFALPLDIAIEIVIAVVLSYVSILSQTRKFKPLKQFAQARSYDSSFFRPNFKNYRTSRAALLLPYLQQRLATDNFHLDLKL